MTDPPMDPEFERLLQEVWRCSYEGSIRWDAACADLWRWHCEQVERATRQALKEWTEKLLNDKGWSDALREEQEPFGGLNAD